MDSDYVKEFPPFHEFQVTYTKDNRCFDPIDGEEELVGSHHQELIEDIIKIECNECHEPLIDIDDEGSPMTGWCGHLFCSKCASNLCKQGDNDEDKARRSDATEEYKIHIAGGQPRILYTCKACNKTHKIEGKEENIYVILFSKNIMLKDIYTELKTGLGFNCEECGTKIGPNKRDGRMHPMFNSLFCETHSSYKKDTPGEYGYTCVWHAYKHFKCKLFVMRPESQLQQENPFIKWHPANRPRKAPLNHRLSSLDRSKRALYAALYHCACCSTSLEKDLETPGKKNPVHRHLECGHFIGDRCLEYTKHRMNTNRTGIFCIFCDAYIKCGHRVQLFIPESKQLAGIVVKQTNEFYKCNVTCRLQSRCTFKPCNTFTVVPVNEKPCRWCKIQHHLAALDKECPDTHNILPVPYQ